MPVKKPCIDGYGDCDEEVVRVEAVNRGGNIQRKATTEDKKAVVEKKKTIVKEEKVAPRESIEEVLQKIENEDVESKNKIKAANDTKNKNIVNNTSGRPILAPTTNVVKTGNYGGADSNVKLIGKIEQNLMYGGGFGNTVQKKNSKIEIKKGAWAEDDLAESTPKYRFEIKKTIPKAGSGSKQNEKNAKISNLKDLAYEAINLRQYEIAVKMYKNMLALDGSDNFVKLSLATTYHLLGQYAQAKPLYVELLPIFPNSEQLISNLLSIIIQESPYEAIYLLPSLANKYNNSPTIQAQTSVAFSSVDRYKEAIIYIRRAIDLDDTNAEYRYNLAVLYDITKQYDKAYRVYRDILDLAKMNGSPIPQRKIEERLTKLKKYV
jgi:tetratricopeptide (TPR) repeat protein